MSHPAAAIHSGSVIEISPVKFRWLPARREAAGAFILDIAQRSGQDADEIVEGALAAARQANDPATIKLINDKRIPRDLLAAQLLRKDLQLAGEDIGVLPISFQQAKEMSDALNQISFKTQDSTAKMQIDNVQNTSL